MGAIKVQLYVERTADFYRALDLLRAEDSYQSSAALLAIHSAISYADALRTALGDERLYADDHRSAVSSLRSLLVGQLASLRNSIWRVGLMIAEEKLLGRAKNSMLEFLTHRLYVPRIYLDAPWGGDRLDVLAIDRDGSGDVHAAFIFPENYHGSQLDLVNKAETERDLLERFKKIDAQYKWIGRVRSQKQSDEYKRGWPADFLDMTFAPDGIGRVGIVMIDLKEDGEPTVTVEIKPERFRAFVGKIADQYVAEHPADWQIRE